MDLGDNQLFPLRVLGEGTFGRVFLAKCHKCKTPHDVCVKRIIVYHKKTDKRMLMEEVYIISQLKHPNIVKFIRSFVHAGTVNIVMEYLPNGTLRDRLNRYHEYPITKMQLLQYFLDILFGLEYLHIRHVIHRDLKPENLMFDCGFRIKICDFGISAIHPTSKQEISFFGTPFYMAPEIMRGDKFDFKSDIWSFGCTVYEMCMGQGPFAQAISINDLRYLTRILTRTKLNCQIIGMHYGTVWSMVCQQMLLYEPSRRISLPDLICIDPMITIPYYHKYFNYKY